MCVCAVVLEIEIKFGPFYLFGNNFPFITFACDQHLPVCCIPMAVPL